VSISVVAPVVILVVIGDKNNAKNANNERRDPVTRTMRGVEKAIKKGLNSLKLLLRPYVYNGRDERI
jgi:hypothetical protein